MHLLSLPIVTSLVVLGSNTLVLLSALGSFFDKFVISNLFPSKGVIWNITFPADIISFCLIVNE